MTTITCPGCGLLLRIQENWRGRAVRCAKCKRTTRAPSLPPSGVNTVAQSLDTPPKLHESLPQALQEQTINQKVVAAARGEERPTIPGFTVLQELGRGGMGLVFLARDEKLKRHVALKLILTGSYADAEELRHFRNEAEAVAQLHHPNIVQIYAIDEHAGRPFLVLEYVDGGSLADRLRESPLPAKQAAALCETLARAMDAAHAKGIVHRDLKPANILLTKDDTPKIADFGLAKQLDQETLTVTGAIKGTPSYMAPEQTAQSNEKITAKADVYALGAILYQCLTGRPPFLGATTFETLAQVRSQEPAPPRRLQPTTPRDLETICLKCLRKEPSARYAGAAHLGDDLRRWLGGEPISARRASVVERVIRWSRRKPALAALTFSLFLSLVVGLSLALWQWGKAEYNYRQMTVQKGIADSKSKLASKNEKKAKANLALAEERLQQSRQRSYVLAMNLAYQAWQDRQLHRIDQLMRQQMPQGDQNDLRGLEWFLLWKLTHQEKKTWQQYVGEFAISPDGRRLLAGRYKKLVLFDIETEERLKEFPLGNGVLDVKFSPDGKSAAVAYGQWAHGPTMPQGVKFINLESGDYEDLFASREPTRTETTTSIDFSPDGVFLAATFHNRGGIRVWNLKEKMPPVTLPGRNIRMVGFAADSNTIVASDANIGNVFVWDLQNQELKAKFPARVTTTPNIAVSRSRNLLASISEDSDAVILRDLQPLQVIGSLDLSEKPMPSRWDMTFSPDGKILALAGGDHIVGGQIQVWDIDSRQLIESYTGHREYVFDIEFTPDGKTLVSSGWDRTVKFWQVPKLATRPSQRHLDRINAIAVSPDDKILASASDDKTVKLWSLETYRLITTLRGHTKRVRALAFSPDGGKLLTVQSGKIYVWDREANWKLASRPHPRSLGILPGPSTDYGGIDISPDGKSFAIPDKEDEIVIRRMGTGAFIKRLLGHTDWVSGVVFSSDSKTLFSASHDRTVREWNLNSGQNQILFRTDSEIYSLAISPNGQFLGAGCKDGKIILWNLKQHKHVAALVGHTKGVLSLTFIHQNYALISGSYDETVRIWNIRTKGQTRVLRRHTQPVTAVVFTQKPFHAISAGLDRNIYNWNTRKGQSDFVIGAREARGLAYSPDGKQLAIGRFCGLWLRDMETGEETLWPHRFKDWVCLGWCGRHNLVATGTGFYRGQFKSKIQLWDATSKKMLKELDGNVGGTMNLAISPDGRLAAAGDWRPGAGSKKDVPVHVWNTATGESLFQLMHDWETYDVAFSPNGKLLAVATGGRWYNLAGELKVWDMTTGKEVANLKGHHGPVRCVSFSPDGKTLASASRDSSVKLWDTATWNLKYNLEGHAATIQDIAFSPDGRRLVSGSTDRQIIFWDPHSGDRLASLTLESSLACLTFSPDGRHLVVGSSAVVPDDDIVMFEIPDRAYVDPLMQSSQ